jgi:hypothetical protein
MVLGLEMIGFAGTGPDLGAFVLQIIQFSTRLPATAPRRMYSKIFDAYQFIIHHPSTTHMHMLDSTLQLLTPLLLLPLTESNRRVA